MSTPSRKRLMRDFKRLQQDPPAGISGAPHDNNIMLWNAVIFGPDDTPWDGGTFKLTLQFSEDYPNKPPTVRFVSRMFHPNSKFEACSFLFFIYIFSPEVVSKLYFLQMRQVLGVQQWWMDRAFSESMLVVVTDITICFSSLFSWSEMDFYADGSICLDILQNQWSPIYDVAAILTSIQSLLCDPNPNSPANSEAARMYSENKREYNRRVRESVEQSWTAD
ncbi:hypothetical protein RHGRI_034541 [Rhododendron griersonianum]|uniref:UBC core domain-containing protein n=1 Tax=Rhododendron griersonianum TaxID=479676 RepID=A0AAV6I4B8_9ERIC|nr:hypothetical protein RHGRI_034541 [Rhododendron griersonianum]